MIIAAGIRKNTACKSPVKSYFPNRAVYCDVDHVTQEGIQSTRYKQLIDWIGNCQYLCSNFHYFINWVFETPRVALDFMCDLTFLNDQKKVKGLIANASHEIRMERLMNRLDWERE